MSLDRRQGVEADFGAGGFEGGGQFSCCWSSGNRKSVSTPRTSAWPLKLAGEQGADAFVTVAGIESVHRARQVQVAARIELADKFARVGFQVRLDLETHAEQGLGKVILALATETLAPFGGRSGR